MEPYFFVLFASTIFGEFSTIENRIQSGIGAVFGPVTLSIQIGLVMSASIRPHLVVIVLFILSISERLLCTTIKIALLYSRRNFALIEHFAQTFFTEVKMITGHVEQVV